MPFCDFIQNLSQAPSMCIFRWINSIISISAHRKRPEMVVSGSTNQVWTKNTIRSYAHVFCLSYKQCVFEAKVVIWIWLYRLHFIRTKAIREPYWYYEQFFSCLEMNHLSCVLPKWILLHQIEISCHIFKIDNFPKFFGDLMSHIIREYEGKEMK